MVKKATTTILVVDDVEASRYTLSRMLQKARFIVTEAATGKDALRLASEKPDLIILDVNLPDLNGHEVCKRIKADRATSSIPVLHLSASFVESDNRSIGLESGADGYLTYPVEPRELFATIEALLRARRAEQEVREQRELLQVTLASIGDAVIATDPDGLVAFLNLVAAALTGWKLTEAVGKPLAEVFDIRDRRTGIVAENPVDRIIRNGSVAGLAGPTTLTGKNGSVYLIEDSASPICDMTGDIVGVVLVFRDVTERYRAEERRRQTEERWSSMVESVTDYAFFSTDVNGIVTSWNIGAERMFGYRDEGILGQSSDALFTSEDVASNQPTQERRIAGHEGRAIDERWHRRADGSRFFASGVMTPMHDESGILIGYTKVARDITQRRQNEEEISRLLAVEQSNAQRLRQIAAVSLNVNATLSIASILNVVTEQARLIVGAHQAVSSMAVNEQGAQAVQSVSLSTKYAGGNQYDAKPSARGLYLKVCQTNRPMRLKIAELDGHSVWQASGEEPGNHPPMRGCLAAPFIWSSGRNKGLILLSDKFEGEFSADDEAVLAQLALVASVATENAHLYQEIRQADERKDEFLAVLAHELRNPLAPIRNALRILGESGDDPQAFAKLRKMMERQIEQMVRLVDDLLDLSRISRGRIELQLRELELSDVINNALETSRVFIEAAGHELSVVLPSEPVYLRGDMTRLSQIVMNLLNNAAKYTDRGGKIWLTVDVGAEQSAIRIRDNGVGIPAEMLNRIFDMFAQVDEVSKRTQGGLGIGLTLARTLVSLHGGSIEAFSAGLGKGSEFVVHLPRIAKSFVVPASNEAPHEIERAAAPRFRILVVDDNRDAAESMATLLELCGNEVAIAHDGLSGIKTAVSFRPDVALLDIGLPFLNGYEVARQIRLQLPEITSLIAITGWGQSKDIQRSQDAGFDHHLVKPVDFDVLRKLLGEVFLLTHRPSGLSSQRPA